MHCKFLLIDDDEDEFMIFNEALAQVDESGICRWADSAEAALALLQSETPDIIFLDLNMPRISGLECLKEMKKLDQLQDVPIIVYSHGMNYSMYMKCMEAGASGCVTKVLAIPELVNIISWVRTHKNYADIYHHFAT